MSSTTRLKGSPAKLRYGVALIGVALATAIRLALDGILGARLPFTAYLFTAILVAIYCGLGPAVLAVVLWAISSVGFSFYLANFADYGVTYGSLGAAVGLLFYLYLCASVVLLGAEVNAAIYHSGPDGSEQAEKPGSDHETTDTQSKRVNDV